MLKNNYRLKLQILILTGLYLIILVAPTLSQIKKFSLDEATARLPHIDGKLTNADYLYTTAGNRLYCIGSQDGRFPNVGFHLPGEMGGIWQQPIKLMDGFGFTIKDHNSGQIFTQLCEKFTVFSFAGKFQYSTGTENIAVTQTQFVPDDLPVIAVEYKIQNTSNQRRLIDFDLHAAIDLLPVWLAERIHLTDGNDSLVSFNKKNNLLVFKDGLNDWWTGIGFETVPARYAATRKAIDYGKGVNATITFEYDLSAGAIEYMRFYISGSTNNLDEIEKNIAFSKSKLPILFEKKKKRFNMLEQTAAIEVPDSLLQTAYTWGKYTSDWLRRDVPGLGKGLSAGLPDYPWFFSNDQATTFMALTGTIQPRLFYNSFHFLKTISDKTNQGSGQIIHEVSDNGVVYNKGNMQESQLHIIAAWQIFKWTGNLEFLKENYAFAKRTWAWLQQHDSNHNGYIEGYGGVEIEGLNDEMLDVQINTFRFLDILSKMASIFNEPQLAKNYATKAQTLKNNINKDWWVESEHSYADFLTNRGKALQIIDDALTKRVKPERNKWAMAKLNQLKASILDSSYHSNGYLVYYNASILEPATEGMVDTARARAMIEKASFFTNRFGTYIAGIERPDVVAIDERPFQKDSTFTYNRAVMPAASSGLIQAAARYGMQDTALYFMHQTLNSFSYASPGTIYEVSPDYGMFVQAWNISCINVPLIKYFFGVEPDAVKKEITIRLRMPREWESAAIKNLLIGNSYLSIRYKKLNGLVDCSIQMTEPGWKIYYIIDKINGTIKLNHHAIALKNGIIELSGRANTIQY